MVARRCLKCFKAHASYWPALGYWLCKECYHASQNGHSPEKKPKKKSSKANYISKSTASNKKSSVVRPIIEKWRPRLLLGEWAINLNYPESDVDQSGDRTILAYVSADPVYLNATIHIYPAWFDRSDEVREMTLVHELCHCFTQEVWNMMDMQHRGEVVPDRYQREAVERLTQRITNAVYWCVRE